MIPPKGGTRNDPKGCLTMHGDCRCTLLCGLPTLSRRGVHFSLFPEQYQHIIIFFFRHDDVTFAIVVKIGNGNAMWTMTDANWRVGSQHNSGSSSEVDS